MREDLHYPMVEAGITCGCNQFGAGCEAGRALQGQVIKAYDEYRAAVTHYHGTTGAREKHEVLVKAQEVYINHLRDSSRD